MRQTRAVIVLGPYRSGTSLVSQICGKLGVDFGPRRQMHRGTRQNPGGYYERKDINDANTALIASAGGSLADPGAPEHLAEAGRLPVLNAGVDVGWAERRRLWGIKDPRMCATLRAWFEAGLLQPEHTMIVHVKRDIEAATRSGMRSPNIPNYCDGSEDGVRQMLTRYADYAQRHVDGLGLPAHELRYEALIADPQPTVAALAGFLGVTQPRRVRAAAAIVGKRRALALHYLHFWLCDAPFRAVSRLSRWSGRPLRPRQTAPGSAR